MKIIGENPKLKKTSVTFYGDNSDPDKATALYPCGEGGFRNWRTGWEVKSEDMYPLPYAPIFKMKFKIESIREDNVYLQDIDSGVTYTMKTHQAMNLVEFIMKGWIYKIDDETLYGLFAIRKNGSSFTLSLLAPSFFTPVELMRLNGWQND
jgi:hypothetical protein